MHFGTNFLAHPLTMTIQNAHIYIMLDLSTWENILDFKKMILKIQKSNLNMLTMTYIKCPIKYIGG
jgi:hypothetical protein